MTERAYKSMRNAGAAGITIGIISIVVGVVSGVLLLICGANLLKTKKELTF